MDAVTCCAIEQYILVQGRTGNNKKSKVCGILELSRRLYYDLWVHLLKSERAMKRKSEVAL